MGVGNIPSPGLFMQKYLHRWQGDQFDRMVTTVLLLCSISTCFKSGGFDYDIVSLAACLLAYVDCGLRRVKPMVSDSSGQDHHATSELSAR